MRKYPYMSQDGPYDREKIINLCLGAPSLIKDTYIYQDRLISMLGNIFRSRDEEKIYREELDMLFSMCAELERSLTGSPEASRKIRNFYTDLCSIANIKQQMGAFYFLNSALPLFTDLVSVPGVNDPRAFVLAAPEIIKLTVSAFNIMTMECYAGESECERVKNIGECRAGKTVWWQNGALVTLVYAVSRLRTGSLAIETGPALDRAVDKVSRTANGGLAAGLPDASFSLIKKYRTENIRAVYSVYPKEEIENADRLSPVNHGRLPSEDEIKEALSV